MKTVIISARWYAITAAAEYIYRGFLQAYPDWKIIRVGPTHSNEMPYKTGIFVKPEYTIIPELVLPNTLTEVPIRYVENELRNKLQIDSVDLWIDVNAGFRLSGRPVTGIRTLFMTDPHTHLNVTYSDTERDYDYLFNPQRNYWLSNVSDDRQRYLPYAADEWFRRSTEFPKVYDVSLSGNLYAERVDYFERLGARNLRTFFDVGVGKWDSGIIYNQSRIGFNWSSKQDLVCRVFEIGYSDAILLTNRITALEEHFVEGRHYVGFSNVDEAVSRTVEILGDLETYQSLRDNMSEEIKNKHCWFHRAIEICKIVGLT